MRPRSLTRRSLRRGFALLATGVAVAGCGSPTGGDDQTAGALEAVSGSRQVTLPNARVPRPLVVRALDAEGRPRAELLVRWTGSPGTSFESDTSRTDANGIARAEWVLGAGTTTYAAHAAANGFTTADFEGSVDPASLQLSVVPDTARFSSLGDTATIMIRVRSAALNLDTLVFSHGWGGTVNSVAMPAFVGNANLVVMSVRNGTSGMYAAFGRVLVPFTAIVRQRPVALRIVPAASSVSVPDTLVVGPDSLMPLAVLAVDARARIVEGSDALAGLMWESSHPDVAAVSPDGVVHSIKDGVVSLTARYDTLHVATALRVWTLRAKVVRAGGGSTCAVLSDDGVACWGFRTVGANSEVDKALAPERRAIGSAPALDLSDDGACLLDAQGAARCWGRNELGQLGRGAAGAYASVPALVQGGLTFSAIGAGPSHNCGLTTDGRTFCWGASVGGMLGNGTYGTSTCGTEGCAPQPVEVGGHHTFVTLAVGGGHTCGLTADGRAWCWGFNNAGQLGSPVVRCAGYAGADSATSGYRCSTVPVAVDGDLRFRSITAGDLHTCAIALDDALYCWGGNLNGVLGVPAAAETQPNAVPARVGGTMRFSEVNSNGQQHTCAIDLAGEAWCWGLNASGQLGTQAAATDQCLNGKCNRSPVRVSGGIAFRQITTGFSHTCGVSVTDVLYCWGWGGSGALGTGTAVNAMGPVRVAFQAASAATAIAGSR